MQMEAFYLVQKLYGLEPAARGALDLLTRFEATARGVDLVRVISRNFGNFSGEVLKSKKDNSVSQRKKIYSVQLRL